MKHIYTLFIALLVLVVSAQAQVTIYHENFSGNTSGVSYSGSSDWQYSNSIPSADAASPSTASGGMHIRTIPSNKSNETSVFNFVGTFSTIGFKDIQITWLDYRTTPNGQNTNNSPVNLFYSIDNGVTYTPVNVIQSTTYAAWNTSTATLPIGNVTASNIKLRWQINTPSTNRDYYAIDDITITGKPEGGLSTFDWGSRPLNENPFTVSAPNSSTPYTVDGVKMYWSRTSDTNVSITESHVTSRFQAPKQSFSLVQSGASSTTGTDVQVQFSEAVSDLSMTFLDVDQATGQFQDRITVIGYDALGASIVPSRNMVVRSFSTSYTESNGILGISGSDIVATSNLADVKVTFSTAVVRVAIRYFNDDSARGQQGIGIQNLSWRFNQPINPLPVELTSFKGQRSSHGVSLAWATASELDNKGFEVQTSSDGRNYKTVAFVESKVGTTSLTQNYSFTHKNPAAGTNYYRLRQVDFDGTFEFSKTIAVQFTLAAASSVYPTMATEQVTVKLLHTDEQVTVLLSDMNGRQVLQVQDPTERELVLPVNNLQQGMYFVTIMTNNNQKEVFRFVKR